MEKQLLHDKQLSESEIKMYITTELIQLRYTIVVGDPQVATVVAQWNQDKALITKDQLYELLSTLPSFDAFVKNLTYVTSRTDQIISFLMSHGYFVDIADKGKTIFTCTEKISQESIKKLVHSYIFRRRGLKTSSIQAGYINQPGYPHNGRFISDVCIVNTAKVDEIYGLLCPTLTRQQRYDIVLVNELASAVGYGSHSSSLSEYYSDVCSMRYSSQYVWYMLINMLGAYYKKVDPGNYKDSFQGFEKSLSKYISSSEINEMMNNPVLGSSSLSKMLEVITPSIRKSIEINIDRIAEDFIRAYPDMK